MGFSVGRLDWWNIKNEHSPYEWALQIAADRIEPLGDNRADMRSARNTVRLIQALCPDLPADAAIEEVQNLRNYLDFNQPTDDETLFPEEAQALAESNPIG